MNSMLFPFVALAIDVVAIVILVIFTVLGVKRGFAKTFFKTFGFILALIGAVSLCSTSAQFLQTKFNFINIVGNWLKGGLTGFFGENLMDTPLSEISGKEFFEGKNVAGWLVATIISVKTKGGYPVGTTLGEVICSTFGYYVVAVIATIGLFILLKIIFFLLGEVIYKMHEIKPIGVLDKFLGVFIGFFRGVIWVQIILTILSIIPIGFVQMISIATGEAIITSLIQKINVFLIIFNTISTINLPGIINAII